LSRIRLLPPSTFIHRKEIVMRHSQTIKHGLDTAAASTESLLNGGILIALGLSMFIVNQWPGFTVRTIIALAWGIFCLLLKGPELVRLIRRTE
jgi:hypothetical protein